MKIKTHRNTIITIVLCTFLGVTFLLFIIPRESRTPSVEFKNFNQRLSWSAISGERYGDYYTVDFYSFSFDDLLIKNTNWFKIIHIGIALSIEVNISDVNGTYIDQLEKTTLWEGLAIWDGCWDFESPLINLGSLKHIYSTGFKFQACLIFKYTLEDSIFTSSIHESKILMEKIEHENS
jgi:hypothetical protein